MPDKDAGTPRVFLVRHGQTEWSISGKHTGKTDIPLTAHGIEQVTSTAKLAVGHGKLIDPSKIAKAWDGVKELKETGRFETTEELAEWDYGAYEGLKPKEIRSFRKEKGLDTDQPWDIWRDGCEDGESPAEVTARIDALIAKIRALQGPCINGEKHADVILVAHGHLTRAFAKRWLGYPLDNPLSLMMEPGGVGILSYNHHNVEEPALFLGIGFPAQS
ncbi:hypothetical protein MBLNU459_g0670t2 [Dothideomycetes sp. NU459]